MNKYQLFLYDVGLNLKTRALEAKAERDAAAPDSEERCLHSGRVLAFNEVISIIQQDALGFQIPLADLRLDNFEPDVELI